MENIVWRRSSYDQQVHAFPLQQLAEPGRSSLEAVCRHCAVIAALEPVVHVAGHWSALLDADTCMACLVVVSDQLAEAGRRPGTPPP